jgi:hypothetical protein
LLNPFLSNPVLSKPFPQHTTAFASDEFERHSAVPAEDATGHGQLHAQLDLQLML